MYDQIFAPLQMIKQQHLKRKKKKRICFLLNILLQFWQEIYRSDSATNVVGCSRKIEHIPCKSIFFGSRIHAEPLADSNESRGLGVENHCSRHCTCKLCYRTKAIQLPAGQWFPVTVYKNFQSASKATFGPHLIFGYFHKL